MNYFKYLFVVLVCAAAGSGCTPEYAEYESVTLDVWDCRGDQPKIIRNDALFSEVPKVNRAEFNDGKDSLNGLIQSAKQ